MISVTGGGGYWHARRRGPFAGTDAGEGVLRQLIPTGLRAAGLDAASKVGLLGWSMGGYGALLLAPRLQGRTLGCAAMSAALWTSAGLSAPGAFDDAADFHRHDVLHRLDLLRHTPVALRCGTEDPFIAADRLFVRRRPGTDHVFDAGGHDEGYWSKHAPALLDRLGRAA